MIRLICPRCQKDSNREEVISFKICPYCGFMFSGKYGVEKRKEKRIAKKMPVVFFYRRQKFEGNTVDFSAKGLCIKTRCKSPVSIGDTVDIVIEDLRSIANIIWTKKQLQHHLYGLQKLS